MTYRKGKWILAGFFLLGAAYSVYDKYRPIPAKDELTVVAGVVEDGELIEEKTKGGDIKRSVNFTLADSKGSYSMDDDQPGFDQVADL